MRLWASKWRQHRVKLEVRADNITALTLILRLKGSSPALNSIAREMALDIGSAAFRPDVVAHTPGVASHIADVLSRKFEPGVIFALPPALTTAQEVRPAKRDAQFWAAARTWQNLMGRT